MRAPLALASGYDRKALVLMQGLVLAHAAETSLPLILQWNLDPILWLGIALFVAAYFYALGPLRRRYGWSATVPRWRVASFIAGTVIFWLALVSPLDTLGDEYFFSMHMVQHMLIAVVVPPLWVMGVPGWMLDPILRRPLINRAARFLTHPAVAFGLFNAMIWIWHVPLLYDATLESEAIHITEHLMFVAAGVVLWWPVLGTAPSLPRISPMFSVFYLFLSCLPMTALGALLTFAAQPLYQPYVEAPRIWGMSALMDQQLGGLIMWVPTNIPYVLALSIIFIRWMQEADNTQRARESAFDEWPEEASGGSTIAATSPTLPGSGA
jgi:putative membrane protein